MEILKLVGKRCLLKVEGSSWARSDVTECKILEVSPSGNWVKLMNLHGNKFWKSIPDISFVEELKDLKAGRPSS